MSYKEPAYNLIEDDPDTVKIYASLIPKGKREGKSEKEIMNLAKQEMIKYRVPPPNKYRGGKRKSKKYHTKKKSLKKRKNKNRTRKNKHNFKAICVLVADKSNVNGIVKFTQYNNKVKVNYEIKGLSNGLHGFHVHEYGDLTDGCTSSCAHFNPFNTHHGAKNSKIRHIGDLGNIRSKNKLAKGYFFDKMISLDSKNVCSIIGRCIVVHEDEDDLGEGCNEESLKTGNAGKRLACGVVGLCK